MVSRNYNEYDEAPQVAETTLKRRVTCGAVVKSYFPQQWVASPILPFRASQN